MFPLYTWTINVSVGDIDVDCTRDCMGIMLPSFTYTGNFAKLKSEVFSLLPFDISSLYKSYQLPAGKYTFTKSFPLSTGATIIDCPNKNWF